MKAIQRVKIAGTRYSPNQDIPAAAVEKLSDDERADLVTRGVISAPAEGAAPANPYAAWNKAKMVEEANDRGLEVTRGDGKDGEPLASDYEKALLASDASRD